MSTGKLSGKPDEMVGGETAIRVWNCPEYRENKWTERHNQGVGWDMSIPLKLFLTLDGNVRIV